MAVFKIQKNKAYFKRYQVKFRRRREAKTDYYARKRLIFQPKDKYATRKYRMVVRVTNQYIICQIIYATIGGDIVVCSANSKELRDYGIKAGLKNYAASYACGLLLARRIVTKFGLDTVHVGISEYPKIAEDLDDLEQENNRKKFKAYLDIGLAHSTTGQKIFGAMKGACDGGLNIPHSHTRFVGNTKEPEEYKPEVHRQHIFGHHVAEYMRKLQKEDQKRYEKQFSQFIKEGIVADNIETMYKNAHAQIRKNPVLEKKDRKKEVKPKLSAVELRKMAIKKITDRKIRVALKKKAILAKIQA